MSLNILNQIVLQKKQEIKILENSKPINFLKQSPLFNCTTKSLIQSLEQSNNGIISEFKRRSPSKKEINFTNSIQEIAKIYQENNSAGMSVLTDIQYFGGSEIDLIQAKEIYKNPILRKDFIVSTYQIYEAKAMGADVVLLIAAILTKQEMYEFGVLAKLLNVEVLVEIHHEEELQKIPFDTNILYGINNRDLKTFKVDFNNAINLCKKLPQNTVKVAESGITSSQDVIFLKEKGFKGFLIGELFMKTDNNSNKIQNFFKEVSNEN